MPNELSDTVADNQQGRRIYRPLPSPEFIECTSDNLLVVPGCILNNGNPCHARTPFCSDGIEHIVYGRGHHVIHNRIGIGNLDAADRMTGTERNRRGDPAHGERNFRIGTRSMCGCNTGNDLVIYTKVTKRLDLFASTAKNKRIPSLETDHCLALDRMTHDLAVDFLRFKMMAGFTLTGIDFQGIELIYQLETYQVIVQDDIGLLQSTFSLDGNQLRIAGTCTCNVDVPLWVGTRIGAPNVMLCTHIQFNFLNLLPGLHHVADSVTPFN